jgi:hypothetical protein
MAEDLQPTKSDAIALFEAIQHKFPSGTLGDDKWYLVTVRWETSIGGLY